MQLKGASERNRRDFIRHAAKAMLGVGIASSCNGSLIASPINDFNKSSNATADSVIYIYLTGGMSHVDTFDTKPGTEAQGPVESIGTSANGIQISQFFPRLARQMHHLAIINSMNSTQGAHEQGKYYMHTSYFVRGTIQHPHMGAWSSHFLGKRNPLLPGNVKIGDGSESLGAGFLESKHAALPINKPSQGLTDSVLAEGVTERQFSKRIRRLRQMNREFQSHYNTKQTRAYAQMYDEAVRLMRSDDLNAFDLTKESEQTRQRYGSHPFGQGCLLAKRLVKRNVRFVEVNQNGWDTHDDNFRRVEENADALDQGLAALIADLNSEGLLNRTLVVVATEFGRTPTIQRNRMGRNHYPQAFTCLLGGGGIQGGIRYGKTDDEGRNVVENLVTVPDFNATIAQAIGLPIKEEVYSPSGRPFTVADKGKPITSIFA